MKEKKGNEIDLPITVKFTLLFLVGEFLKSTLQRYTPSSLCRILSITSVAGFVDGLNRARVPNIDGADQYLASLKARFRTSKLKQEDFFKSKNMLFAVNS